MNESAKARYMVRPAPVSDDLLLRETNHRCSNDLQLVVGLLALQSRKAESAEARQALTDAMERVSILARARTALHQKARHGLGAALRQVAEALHSHAEPRSILVSLEIEAEGQMLSPPQVTTLALVVNELATNAIKHAFEAEVAGHISIKVREYDQSGVSILVDDDGLPFPEPGKTTGLGLGLVKRLVASAGGLFLSPPSGSKTFEIRIPAVPAL
jgi:two-component sensor histidine kinase